MEQNRTLKYIVALLWSLISLPLIAGESLYEVKLEVSDQSAGVRLEAMPVAMEQVLVKVSGYSGVVANPFTKARLSTAKNYVQQYRYSHEDWSAAELEANPELPPQRLMLWLRFDKKGINQILQEAGVPVWGSNRPLTLVWLAVQHSGKRLLVGADDSGLAREYLEKQAKQRALPIRFPMLDLVDKKKIRAAHVWGNFRDVIQDASERYQPRAILTGKLYPLSRGHKVEWRLFHEEQQFNWEARGDDVEALLASGIDSATDNLATLFAQSYETGSEEVVFVIEEIDDFNALRRVTRYLESVPGISRVAIRRIEASIVRLKLDTEGGLDYVLKSISTGGVLQQIERPIELIAPPVEHGTPSTMNGGQQETEATVEEPAPDGESVPEEEPMPEEELVPQERELVFRLMS